MREHYDYLIIGGGLAGGHAVQELCRTVPDARIGMIAEEEVLPYNRPPLSKGFLQGTVSRESLAIKGNDYYREHGVGLQLGVRAAGVDPAAHAVVTDDGSEHEYGKLLIASGCRLRRLSIPGAGTPGIYYLRTVVDAEALRTVASNAGQAVVIGAGFIGLEVASTLTQMGLGVTVIHRRDRLMEKFADEDISAFFEKFFLDRGVHVIFEDEAAAINGRERVESITTRSGRTLPCDFAVAGIGVVPETSYLEDSGIELDRGVVVDKCLRTSDPDIFAAGDIANYYDPVFGRRRRIEHWDNAIRQGRAAARNMIGGMEPFEHVSYFYSTVFSLTYEFYGDMREYDEVAVRGSFTDNSVAVFYLKDEVVQAAFMLNRPASERDVVKDLIAGQRQHTAARRQLEDDRVPLEVALAK